MPGVARFRIPKALARMAFVISFLFLAAGCDTFDSVVGEDGWFSDKKRALPGERISVLIHQTALVPEPDLMDAEILLPPPTANPDWPQPGGYANHAMQHIKVNDVLERAWSTDIGAGAGDEERLIGSPIVAAGRVFVMDAETLISAYNAETGKQLWETELTPDEEDDGHFGGGLAYNQGRVFVSTGFAQLIALNAETGSELWRKSVSGPMRTAPTIQGGRVFAITVDNKLHVLNATNGNNIWSHSGIFEAASMLGGGSPAIDAGVVVVPYSSGELVALKVENGRVLWSDSLASRRRSNQVSTMSHIRGSPVIDRGQVFAVSHGGVTVAIDLRTGQRIWEREIGGLENPWVAGDYVFLLTVDSEVVSLSRKDGRIHWVRALARFEDEEDKEDPIVWTGPILASDRLILSGSHGEILAVSPYTGQILGVEELSDGISVPPVIAGGSVFFLSDNADLVAYR